MCNDNYNARIPYSAVDKTVRLLLGRVSPIDLAFKYIAAM